LEAEYQLMKEYPDLKVDVLVLGHHGSKHSSAYELNVPCSTVLLNGILSSCILAKTSLLG
jgi:hypothetical protein